jgi:hypothetical protein
MKIMIFEILRLSKIMVNGFYVCGEKVCLKDCEVCEQLFNEFKMKS